MNPNFDQVTCCACNCVEYKDDAIKVDGEWYCERCAYEAVEDDGPHISYNGD